MTELIYNIQEIFDSQSRRGCLQQHGCIAYSIPPYQRGYKWGSEPNQPVERLLSDLLQAWQSKSKEYMLQALTVKKVWDNQDRWVLEVIDGQQRLTTLFILIHALTFRLNGAMHPNESEGKIHYRVRHEESSLDGLVVKWIDSVGNSNESFDQLKATNNVEQEERQDFFYLKCAALRCMHATGELTSMDASLSNHSLSEFRKFVLQAVKLMVNAVEAHVSGEVVFGNLNSNRIVLTEVELIKGLLLTRVAREPTATRERRYREVLELRIQIGQKWDEVYHWANRKEIHSLYFPAFEDGMMGLLELVTRRMTAPYNRPITKTLDAKPLFEYLLGQSGYVQIFELLSNTHSILSDWIEDDEVYHLLGYCLIQQGVGARVPFLVSLLICKTKTERDNKLKNHRKKHLLGIGASTFHELRYGRDNTRIESIVLALSVFQTQRNGRFNFNAFQEQKWSLEHIFPQSPFGKGAALSLAQKSKILDILEKNEQRVLTEETAKKLANLRAADEVANESLIARLLDSEPLLHQMGNLCLLSPSDNAAMGCGMFYEKRDVIRRRIALGSFVPSHTYEVFSKMIVGGNNNLDIWSKEDIEKHQQEIMRRIAALTEEGA